MLNLEQTRYHTIPIHLASEYWYCAAKIYHNTRLGGVQTKQKQTGKERHERKAIQDLKSIPNDFTPLKPGSIEQFKEIMLNQVKNALEAKIVLTNSDETTLYYGVIPHLNCIGKPDAVDCSNGDYPIIVERKYTKHTPTEPYLDHKIQAHLYMMTLSELGFNPVTSRIEYWSQDNNKLMASFDLDFEKELQEKAIQGVKGTAQILMGSNELIATQNPNKCKVCEYRIVCKWRTDIRCYSPPYFLDIETNLAGNLIWCIGIYDPVDSSFNQFFLEPGDEESNILTKMVEIVSKRPMSNILTFSGSNFDNRVIGKQLIANSMDSSIVNRIWDVHPRLMWKLGVKKTGGLKLLSSFYGFRYEIEMNGIEAAILYGDYLNSSDELIRNQLLRYNKDDVMALAHLAINIQDAFEITSTSQMNKEDRDLLRIFYECSNLKIRKRVGKGLDVELKFRISNKLDEITLKALLDKHGFNARPGIDKKKPVLRLYGYTRVSEILTLMGDSLDEIMNARGIKRYDF